eukprot:6214153-Pleurochrysis_carterae.AAC.1
MTPRIKEHMSGPTTRAEHKYLNPKLAARVDDYVDLQVAGDAEGNNAGGKSNRLRFRLNVAAAAKGEWDAVCDCGWNACLAGFCEHAAGVCMLATVAAGMELFLKPWSTVKAWHAQLIGDSTLEQMALAKRPAWNSIVDMADMLKENGKLKPVLVAWYKTRMPGKPRTKARQQSVREVFSNAAHAMQQAVDDTLGYKRSGKSKRMADDDAVEAAHSVHTAHADDGKETKGQGTGGKGQGHRKRSAPVGAHDGDPRKRKKTCGYCGRADGHNARSCPVRLGGEATVQLSQQGDLDTAVNTGAAENGNDGDMDISSEVAGLDDTVAAQERKEKRQQVQGTGGAATAGAAVARAETARVAAAASAGAAAAAAGVSSASARGVATSTSTITPTATEAEVARNKKRRLSQVDESPSGRETLLPKKAKKCVTTRAMTKLCNELRHAVGGDWSADRQVRGMWLLRAMRAISDGGAGLFYTDVDYNQFPEGTPHPEVENAAAIEWKALISLSRLLSRSELVEYDVSSDGNCWMWAVLNDFDLVENAKSPTARDYRMILCVRQLMYDWVTADTEASESFRRQEKLLLNGDKAPEGEDSGAYRSVKQLLRLGEYSCDIWLMLLAQVMETEIVVVDSMQLRLHRIYKHYHFSPRLDAWPLQHTISLHGLVNNLRKAIPATTTGGSTATSAHASSVIIVWNGSVSASGHYHGILRFDRRGARFPSKVPDRVRDVIATEVAKVPALAPMDAAQIKLLQEYRASKTEVNESETAVDVDVDADGHELNSEASVGSSSGVAGQLPPQESVQLESVQLEPEVELNSLARLDDEGFGEFPDFSQDVDTDNNVSGHCRGLLV